MLCQNSNISPNVSSSYFLRAAALAVLLAMAACGSKSSSGPETKQAARSETETAVPAVLPVTPDSGADSASTRAPADEPPFVPEPETLPDVIKRTFSGSASVRSESDPFPHRVVRDSAGRVLGYEAFSDSAGVTARGYAGMVPLQVFFDAQGKPVRIYILENYETPVYMDIVSGSGLLERLLAFDPTRPDSLDAVTLATSSSRAIIAGVTGLAVRVSAEVVAKGQVVR
jgi:hypothetical protein